MEEFKGKSLQDFYAPKSICYGCGPANVQGLQIKSYVAQNEPEKSQDKILARFLPKKFHEAFPGVVNGGIIGSLLDCHCNWTATYFLMKKQGVSHPPCTVTAEYTIKMRRPTPSNTTLLLSAWVKEIHTDRATIEGELTADGKICATCTGIFVAVKEGHPAFHRW